MSPKQKYLLKRLNFLKELHSVAGVSRAEIIILLTAILSTCASISFPKTKKDRNDRVRFVELLVSKSPDYFHINWGSIPSLINARLVDEQNTKYGLPGEYTRVFTDEEIDMPIEDAKEKWGISSENLKKYCYANLIYNERCAYAHEYTHPKTTTPIAATNRTNRVSYIGRFANETITKSLTLNLDYLYQVTEFHIKNLIEDDNKPATWWLDSN